MLQINNVTIYHRRDLRKLIDGASFVLNDGDRAVMIGEEGNGKSSLMKWIYDPGLVDEYLEVRGECNRGDLVMAYLPQEMDEDTRELSVRDYMSLNERFLEAVPSVISRIASEVMIDSDIFESERKMGTLSGGERIKVQMASIILKDPDVYLLDEPSNDIDIDTIRWMEDFIGNCDRIVLFISHDEALIEKCANRIILIEQLRRKTVSRFSVSGQSFSEFMKSRSEGFRKQEQMAVNERMRAKEAEERFRKIQQKVEHDQRYISRQDPHGGRLLKKKMASVKALQKRKEREAADMTEFPEYEEAVSIRMNEVTELPNGREVLDYRTDTLMSPSGKVLSRDVSLLVKGPEKICIIGRNGCGKSTLLKDMYENMKKSRSIIPFFMPQDYGEIMDMTVKPVEFLFPRASKDEITRAKTILGSMNYTSYEMEHSIKDLSGGQKAKLILVKISLSGANVLFLDEPTRNFSPLSGPEIRGLLRSFSGAIISVSHDRKYISEVCDKVYELNERGLTRTELRL